MNPPVSPIFELNSPYRKLARALDALPNRFPPAQDGSELKLLAKIFTPEEAELAADLLPEMEQPAQISARLGRDMRELAGMLKEMSKKGLISVGKTAEGRLGFALMPFVVGIYEAQIDRIDAELAKLFEDYYQKAFATSLKVTPQVHRVIPVRVAVENNTEVAPFESVSALVDRMQSWGVIDCICRTQKALIGDPCQHPVDVCMVLSEKPDAFSSDGTVTPLDRQGALNTLQRAADAGLVHCVSNNQQEMWYICNCCTCSCAILRGMAEMGIANVVARSAFINRVNEDLCIACGKCVDACPFKALSVDDVAHVREITCTGCGLCITVCPQGALALERRADADLPPETEADWRVARRNASE